MGFLFHVLLTTQYMNQIDWLIDWLINRLIVAVDSDFMQGIKQVFGSDEKKEFVDPYFVCSFAGKKVSVVTGS